MAQKATLPLPAARPTQIRPPEKLLRYPDVRARLPMSRSAWYEGIKAGRYPPPIKLGPKMSAWREADIDELIQSLIAGNQGGEQ